MTLLTWAGIVVSCVLLGMTAFAEMPWVGPVDPLAFVPPVVTPRQARLATSADTPTRVTRFPRFARPASAAPVRLADRFLPKDSLPAVSSRPSLRSMPTATHLFAAPILTAAATLRSNDERDRTAGLRSFDVRRTLSDDTGKLAIATTGGLAVSSHEAETQWAMIEPNRVEQPFEREPPAVAEVPAATVRPTRRPLVPVRVATVAAAANRTPATRRETPVLAYARPDAGDVPASEAPSVGVPLSLQGRGSGTAIYDIEAATVYLPNGEKLEAHSGLGALRDDPRFAHTRNRGVTPPHTYDLTLRESLFHGVQAIRLNPVGGERNIHNRNGLLAHTYMLGPRGDSNGCVSFKDYKRFLAAFRRGEVRRLVVVARLSNPASRFARFFASKG